MNSKTFEQQQTERILNPINPTKITQDLSEKRHFDYRRRSL